MMTVPAYLRNVLFLLCGGTALLAPPGTRADCNLTFDPTSPSFLTSDIVEPVITQDGVDCYAWQMFVALNWPVDPSWPANASAAGEPDRSAKVASWGVPPTAGTPMAGATVWESFKQAPDIFLPDAAAPAGWGVLPDPPPACKGVGKAAANGLSGNKLLRSVSKDAVHPVLRFNLSTGTLPVQSDEIMQAFGGWLTDQRGQLVYFERTVGKAEFDYIVKNALYDAADQLRVATNADGQHPAGLSLPKGASLLAPPPSTQPQEDLGAFETKAAWRVLTGQTELYDRYLTTTSWLLNPDTGVCTQEVIGLVGLHIIHKTAAFPDFIWATFEQVDNVQETASEKPPPGGYSFFNPDCSGSDCTANQARLECKDGQCKPKFPMNDPVQVTRSQATPSIIHSLNSQVQGEISSRTGGKSVFQYYKLVNVLWDASPSPPLQEPGVNAKVPLRYGTFQSAGPVPVANTTMETYIQDTSCTACHASATIAGSKTLASDFSFLFQDAASAKDPALVTVSKEFAK